MRDDLLAADLLWLLGQDEQLCHPKNANLRMAINAAALLDVIDSGAAEWVDREGDAYVRSVGVPAAENLVAVWSRRLRQAGAASPLRAIHAINAVADDTWRAVGADLARRGLAIRVEHKLMRWRSPREIPDPKLSKCLRTHLRAVVRGAAEGTKRDVDVLAVAFCSSAAEDLLSTTALSDPRVLGPLQGFLKGNPLVGRLDPALSYLVSTGPTLGNAAFSGGAP